MTCWFETLEINSLIKFQLLQTYLNLSSLFKHITSSALIGNLSHPEYFLKLSKPMQTRYKKSCPSVEYFHNKHCFFKLACLFFYLCPIIITLYEDCKLPRPADSNQIDLPAWECANDMLWLKSIEFRNADQIQGFFALWLI